MSERLEDSGTPHEAEDRARIVGRMAVEMAAKLERNTHKRHWLDPAINDVYLLHRLREEVDELELSIANGEPDWARWAEAADVANLAAMLADRG